MKDNIFKYFVKLSILMVSLSCLFLISYILLKGVPHLKPSLFSFYYTSENSDGFKYGTPFIKIYKIKYKLEDITTKCDVFTKYLKIKSFI